MASDVSVAIIPAPAGLSGGAEAPVSAVSWGAVIAGAFVAAAVSLILVILGSGLGLSVARPWPGAGASAATFGVMTGVWLIIVQWAASGVGGYLTGRLRTRWHSLHTHEVFFRDTANGFLTWAVATVMVGVLVVGAASLAAGAGARGAAAASAEAGPQAYAVDTLLRSPRPDESPSASVIRAQAERLLARAASGQSLSADEHDWLATTVAARTGLTPTDAGARVEATIAQVRDTADKARKAASAAAIFTALAMLIGALIACVAAALGGQQRDEHL